MANEKFINSLCHVNGLFVIVFKTSTDEGTMTAKSSWVSFFSIAPFNQIALGCNK